MELTPYAILCGCTAGIACLVAGSAWRRHHVPGGTSLAGLMLVVALWSATLAAGLMLETTERSSESVLHRLTDNLKAHNLQTSRPYPLALSFGIAHYDPAKPCSLEALLEIGDQLMYAQKQQKAAQRT